MRLNKVIAATLTAGFVGFSGAALAAHHEGAGEAAEAAMEHMSDTAKGAMGADHGKSADDHGKADDDHGKADDDHGMGHDGDHGEDGDDHGKGHE